MAERYKLLKNEDRGEEGEVNLQAYNPIGKHKNKGLKPHIATCVRVN